MKLLSTICLSAICCLNLVAQSANEDDMNTTRSELSMNMTQLATNLLGNTTIPGTDDFAVFYKLGSQRHLFKAGMGIKVNSSSTVVNSSPLETNSSEYLFSLGYEKRKWLSSKWFFYSGADLLLIFKTNKSSSTRSSGTIFISENGGGFGFQLPYGIGYRISPKILIHTEGNFGFRSVSIKSDQSGLGSFGSGQINNFELKTHLPLSIYLNVRF